LSSVHASKVCDGTVQTRLDKLPKASMAVWYTKLAPGRTVSDHNCRTACKRKCLTWILTLCSLAAFLVVYELCQLSGNIMRYIGLCTKHQTDACSARLSAYKLTSCNTKRVHTATFYQKNVSQWVKFKCTHAWRRSRWNFQALQT
jgi:hypothetical protein